MGLWQIFHSYCSLVILPAYVSVRVSICLGLCPSSPSTSISLFFFSCSLSPARPLNALTCTEFRLSRAYSCTQLAHVCLCVQRDTHTHIVVALSSSTRFFFNWNNDCDITLFQEHWRAFALEKSGGIVTFKYSLASLGLKWKIIFID